MRSRADARGDRLPRPASRAGAVRRLRAQRAPGPRRPRGLDRRHRRQRPRRAHRGARRRRRRPRARPSRALLGGMPQAITPSLHRRLEPLFEHDMALAAYHLPLDGHPEHGNNALLAEGLGCTATEPFALHHGTPIGVAGTFGGDGISDDELVERVSDADRARAAGPAQGPRAGPPHRHRVRRRRGLHRGRRSAGSTPSSPASPRSASPRSPARRACTSSPPAITPPRRSASAASATFSPESFRSCIGSSTYPTRFRHVALKPRCSRP